MNPPTCPELGMGMSIVSHIANQGMMGMTEWTLLWPETIPGKIVYPLINVTSF